MSDKIHITALRAVTVVGALAHEREIAQPLQIDLVLDVDLADAGLSDDLDDTVNYGAVADRVIAVVEDHFDVALHHPAEHGGMARPTLA